MNSAGELPSDVLLTIAEVAIAVLGFAAIVLALRVRSGDGRADLITRTRLSIMIECSSALLGGAFFPFMLAPTNLSPAAVVTFTHFALAAASVGILCLIFGRQRKRFGSLILPEARILDSFGLISALALVALLCARALGLFPELGFGPYIACLLFFLLIAIYVFVRIVFFASDDRHHPGPG